MEKDFQHGQQVQRNRQAARTRTAWRKAERCAMQYKSNQPTEEETVAYIGDLEINDP